MFNLLVVDDEDIAIRGITHGIDWSDMKIKEIFTAYDADEAKEILLKHSIDILLSDIDMPGESGIELLRWANEHKPGTVTLFLTGHADFTFAQQAVQLDCFDYLLKPIDHNELKRCIGGAISKVEEQRKLTEIRSTYDHYSELWRQQRPVLVERFWQDLFHYRLSANPALLDAALASYDIPLKASDPITVILVSIEEWREEWSARDEEIMTYGVKNAAEEMLLGEKGGTVVQEAGGTLYVIGYESYEATQEETAERCRRFITECKAMLHCGLSCYIGKPLLVREARGCIEQLQEQEKRNISNSGAVLLANELDVSRGEIGLQIISFADWSLLLTMGKRTELAYRIDECFDRMLQQKASYTALASFYFGFMNMIFDWMHERSLAVEKVFPGGEWEEGAQALKSLARLRTWSHAMCDLATSYSQHQGGTVSQTVAKVQQYMKERMHEEFSREEAAEYVYLNPAYLSRLFRKETGKSLTDYLVELRIAKAREELSGANNRISDIAQGVGYSNFSHFSQLFKRMTGLTPQEYRKKFQHLQ